MTDMWSRACRTALLLGFVLGTTGVFGVALARASTVEALALRDLVRDAEIIALARVMAIESRWSEGVLVTDVALRVEEWLAGENDRDEVIVRTLGGRVGRVGMLVSGEPTFTIGERAIVFASREGGARSFRILGMSQGALRVMRVSGRDHVVSQVLGLELLQRDAQGAWIKASPAVEAPRPLEDVLRTLRTLIVSERGVAR